MYKLVPYATLITLKAGDSMSESKPAADCESASVAGGEMNELTAANCETEPPVAVMFGGKATATCFTMPCV